MQAFNRLAALAAALGVTLAAPAAALAHPSVYSTTSRLLKTQEVQTITVDAASGNFKPSAGATTIAENATALTVQLALEQDPAIGIGNIEVTGGAGGPYTLKWVGAKLQTNEATVAPVDVSLAGGAGVSVTPDTNGGTNITFLGDATGATMPTQEFYVVAEHGYSPLLKETNGSNEGGMLNLKRLPGTYRTAMTPQQWLDYAAAQTDVQPHPVCEGVAALQNQTNIIAANESATDPFWNYVPFTKTSAGIADDPAVWTDVLLTVLAVPNLNAINTVGEWTAACTGLGGVYRPADLAGSSSPIFSGSLADATTPLNADITAKAGQITTLTADKAALTTSKAAVDAELATLKGVHAALVTAKAAVDAALEQATTGRAISITAAAKRFTMMRGHLVTGPAGATVKVQVTVSAALAKALGVPAVLATDSVKLDSAGAGIAEPMFTKAAKAAIAKRRPVLAVSLVAMSGDMKDMASGTLVD